MAKPKKVSRKPQVKELQALVDEMAQHLQLQMGGKQDLLAKLKEATKSIVALKLMLKVKESAFREMHRTQPPCYVEEVTLTAVTFVTGPPDRPLKITQYWNKYGALLATNEPLVREKASAADKGYAGGEAKGADANVGMPAVDAIREHWRHVERTEDGKDVYAHDSIGEGAAGISDKDLKEVIMPMISKMRPGDVAKAAVKVGIAPAPTTPKRRGRGPKPGGIRAPDRSLVYPGQPGYKILARQKAAAKRSVNKRITKRVAARKRRNGKDATAGIERLIP